MAEIQPDHSGAPNGREKAKVTIEVEGGKLAEVTIRLIRPDESDRHDAGPDDGETAVDRNDADGDGHHPQTIGGNGPVRRAKSRRPRRPQAENEWSLKEPESLIRFVKVEDVYLKNDLYIIMQRLGAEKGFADLANTNGREELCKAAYDHVRGYGWLFDYERGSPHYGSQVIRTPGDVLRDHKGCCLDLACLFAALLENMQVKPVILHVSGDRFAHAVAGYWKNDGAGQPVIREGEFVRKAVRRNEMVLFETTGAVRTPNSTAGEPRRWRENGNGFLPFEDAVKAARNLALSTSVEFDFLLDVVAAREEAILQP